MEKFAPLWSISPNGAIYSRSFGSTLRTAHRFSRTRWRPTAGLARTYVHQVIDRAECYAKGNVHTNGLENFWSIVQAVH